MSVITAQSPVDRSPSPVQSAATKAPAIAPPITPSITVVCCVESGPLETTTLLMLQSLRRWGGRLAGSPVIAVTPRFGPPLMRSTLEQFEQLNVQYVRQKLTKHYSWYAFLNKPLSLVIAEQFAATDLMLWLDADVLIAGEPSAFELEEGVDFAGCPSDRNLGSTGPGDRFESYWSRMCQALRLRVDDLPWVLTCREQARIRFYLNGGVLVYRKASGYGPAYLKGCLDVLDSRICSRDAELFFAEQMTSGLIAVKHRLKSRLLSEQFNYAVGSKAMDGSTPEAFSRARVLHYHDALWPHFFPRFMEMCREGQPALHEWLKDIGPLSNRAPLPWRVLAKGLKAARTSGQRRFVASCERF